MFSAQKSHGHEVGEPTRPRVRFDAPSHRTLPLFRIGSFSGSWRLAFGILPSSLFHSRSSLGLPPYPKSTLSSVCEGLIRVENNLVPTRVPTSHRPQIRPENKGIKPKSNRHQPKNLSRRPLDSGRKPLFQRQNQRSLFITIIPVNPGQG
jgi:hypothetical protein